ncbi:vacuolar protein sorting-associated protein 33A-like isoform X1 [Crassostrea angulata]|uniref:Vacuolar protein sorting-associated protein 33A n=1 Tax=Magallana gigas TaxID=29159 RepID=A0A8W8JS60_MAGGI|nr:vacuolar protein sorting-associated protein 33A isoform X1 [Crassostrea gigas]XP_052712538.1 vacuolar protein sorting-associated protein 33A-like isoform X1 [Crassostrea angulata]
MGSTGHLSNGKLNLNLLRDYYRRELLECLDKCLGSKALVWDDALTGPFGLIAEYSLLKEHEVEKMFPLSDKGLPPSNVQNIIFVTRPKLHLMEQIAQNLLQEEHKGGFRKEYHIIFVPRKSLLCEKKLKESGVYGTLHYIEEFNLSMIPFDSDLMSMEMEGAFKECYLENDYTTMFYVAQSLMTLQFLYGIIPNIQGKGDCAKNVVDMMLRMRRELGGREPQITPQIDNLLILDRNVDLLTPLLSQLTYDGLIDEIFGINNTSVKLPPEKFVSSSQSPEDAPTEKKKIILNSSDELYGELRDKNFNAVGSLVSKKAKTITAEFDERHAAKTVSEMKHFVSKLPHLQQMRQSLSIHTSIAELIKEHTDSEEFLDSLRCQQEFINGLDTDKVNTYVEDCIGKMEPLDKVLRLICIQSYCNNGLKTKVLDYYKREIIQTYGYEHLVTLMNLEKAGLLRQSGQRHYPTIRKSLKLIVDEVNEQNPNDISYVYSGYAPLSIRLAQYHARPGWRSITEVLNLLPGPTIEEIQQIPVALRKRRSSITSSHSSVMDQKVTLVVFLGGVTFAEIAALRFLAQQDDGGTDYVIATTKIISGSTLLDSVMEKLSPVHLNPF